MDRVSIIDFIHQNVNETSRETRIQVLSLILEKKSIFGKIHEKGSGTSIPFRVLSLRQLTQIKKIINKDPSCDSNEFESLETKQIA